jgi:hypothetical protein
MLEGFTITEGSSSGFATHGYFETVEVVGNRIVNNAGGGFYLLGDGIIHKNLIADNGGIGLELAYSSAFVYYNYIANNSDDGIRAYESSADIQDNIVAGKSQTGMGTAGIRCSGSAIPTLDYIFVWRLTIINRLLFPESSNHSNIFLRQLHLHTRGIWVVRSRQTYTAHRCDGFLWCSC